MGLVCLTDKVGSKGMAGGDEVERGGDPDALAAGEAGELEHAGGWGEDRRPGDGKKFVEFDGFHEVLPGLGALVIRPRSDGSADGMEALRRLRSRGFLCRR